MSDAETSGSNQDGGRDYGTVALVVAAVFGLVIAAALLPALSAGAGGTPAESLVPVPQEATGSAGQGGSLPVGETGGTGGSSGFGALNMDDRQSVGGTVRESNSFRSQDTETHFVVRSEEPAYWRTGAYDEYTGDGWTRSAPSDASAPAAGETIRYSVELARSSSTPPTVWRPDSVDGPASLGLGAGRVASVDAPLPRGTEYSGVSRKPPSDPSVLRASGEDYPAEIERRYTQLPAETEEAIAPLTTRVTTNASNPYETAVLVERWLEANKEYSLNVSAPGDDVARQFIFDMEAGYCEYFATSMVAMLRSQDVPARYVVGYSTGEQVDENTYRVRALNAHAWVEVYFEGVGWVRFDPTPGSDRIDRERQSLQDDGVTDEYSPPESGNPSDRDASQTATPTPSSTATTTATTPNQSNTTSTTTSPGTPKRETPAPQLPTPSTSSGGLDLSLNRTVFPGASVEVSVTADGIPVADAEVRFNGEAVGRTDAAGTVSGTVPYTESLTISASGGGQVAAASGGSVPPPADAGTATQENRETITTTLEVPTNVTLSISGDRETGANVTVTALVVDSAPGTDARAEHPVEGARVSLNGDRVARTDDDGRASVTLPPTPGTVTLGVDRGAVSGERQISLAELTATIDQTTRLPIAGAPIEVTAFVGGDPAPGATVSVGSERVGETGADGTLTARLPLESGVPVVVSAGGQTVRTTVSNPLANLAGVFAVVLALVVGGVVTLSRRGMAAREVPAAIAGLVRWSYRSLLRLLVGLVVGGERALLAVVDRSRQSLSVLHEVVSGERSPETATAAARDWVRALPARLASTVERVLPTGQRFTGATADTNTGRTAGASVDPREAVRDAWGRFLEHVSVSRADTRTPGQLASHAITEDGLPADAVARLRDEFRAAEYGPGAHEDAVTEVRAAIEAIEDAATPDDSSESFTVDGDSRDVRSSSAPGPVGGED